MRDSLIIFFLLFFSVFSLDLTPKVPSDYEIAPWYKFKPAAISYTFDDGSANHLTVVVPLFDKYNYKGTFNLITSLNNNWEGYKTAAENGHEIASHTITHPNLKEKDATEQEKELKESKEVIEENIEQECITVAYPFCVTGSVDIEKKYYISGRSCDGQLISPNPKDMFALSSIGIGSETTFKLGTEINDLVDRALKEKKWIVFVIHGIDDVGYSPLDSGELNSHLNYVKKSDQFWVGTFKEISKYILEANSLTIEEDSRGGQTTLQVDCSYKSEITKMDVPVTVSRKISDTCHNPKIYIDSVLEEIESEIKDGKVIFDVVPGRKYLIRC